MRNLGTVIARCLAEIPEDADVGWLRGEAKKIENNIGYTAPELMQDRWFEWIHALQANLGEPDTEWKQRIGIIMSGREG